jgi:hypothetical protein
MNRLYRFLTACVVCSVAACGSDEADDKVTITLFQAAPDAIQLGQSTKLLFVVNPPDAQVAIIGFGDYTGQTSAIVSPTATTTYHLTATKGTATATNDVTVSVGPQNAVGIKLEPASTTPTAGQPVAVTVTATIGNGKPAPGFRGTVHLASTDAKAVLPADLVFTAADAGVKQVMVTLKAAGLSTLTGTETTSPATQGSTSLTVQPAAAVSCTAGQAPAATVAGSVVGVAVVVHDAFGNVATGYTGTVRLTTTDARAILPPDVTYVPATDAGSHAFSAALVTAGSQILSAADTVDASIHCDAAILVAPGAPKITLAVPGNANAGFPVNVDVTVKDVFDNAISNFAGTVSFTSTDTGTGAAAPAPITFTGTEGGIATTSATFVTLGSQIVTASNGGTPAVTGNAATVVHGLVYTAPTSGRVRLVANAAQSNTRVVQLDLVANERLEVSSFFGGGGPGSFAAGMNLPLDTTRVDADTTLFTAGNALVSGPAATPVLPVGVARIGDTDHVLYTGVTRKRVAGTNFTQRTEVQAGQVFYSVRLKLLQAGSVGPVFDGAQPSTLFRAAVRDQYGDDFVSQGDFGLGKLEVR